MQNDIPEDLKKNIDYSFLNSIVNGLYAGKYTPEQAQELAKKFLPIVNATSYTEFINYIKVYVSQNVDFKELTLILDRYDTEKATNQVLEKMRGHMQSGDINSALAVAEEHQKK